MTTSKSVRLAVVGLGDHAVRNVLPAVAAANGVSLAGVQTRDQRRLASVASATGSRSFDTFESLIASNDVDCVYLTTPTGTHFRQTMIAIEAGKHVWCEKPLTTSSKETTRVVDAAAAANVDIRESEMFLYHPQFSYISELVSSQSLGAIKSITARFGFPHLPPENFRYISDLGGGALFDAGFYPCAAAVALLGRSLEVASSTIERNAEHRVDIGGAALAQSEGRAALLEWGFGRGYRNELEVWFEEGSIRAPRAFSKPRDLETHVIIETGEGSHTVSFGPSDHFETMLTQFAASAERRDSDAVREIIARSELMDQIMTNDAVQP